MIQRNLKPQQFAPVQRENTATVSRDGNAHREVDLYEIVPHDWPCYQKTGNPACPFAGDNAE